MLELLLHNSNAMIIEMLEFEGCRTCPMTAKVIYIPQWRRKQIIIGQADR